MTCARAQLRRVVFLGAAFFLLFPFRADAHLPTVGLGPVYDGIFHFLLSPQDLVPVIALSLLGGQRGARFGRRILWLLPLAWFTGGLVGMFVGSGRGSWLMFLSFLLFGGLVASSAKVSLPVLSALAALLGVFHGYLNGSGLSYFSDGTYSLTGMATVVFVIVGLFTSFVIPLRRQWALIVVRVAGSWIAATGLLMLGWAFRQRLAPPILK